MEIRFMAKAIACSVLLFLMTNALAADTTPASTTVPVAAAVNGQALTAFEAKLQTAVEKGITYPKEAVLSGEQGTVVVEFDYAGDGKATNVTVGTTNASGHLNRAAVHAVEKATLPPKPPELSRVTHFHVKLTYTLH